MDNWELGRWISFIGLRGRALLSEWRGGGGDSWSVWFRIGVVRAVGMLE